MFLIERHKLSKLPQKEIENLSRPARSKDTELVIKNLPHTKSPGLRGFTGNSTKHLNN